jgi:16S rRNA (adenine1518-N6/adenine1519-N6)-dimethyltransferase
MSLKEIDALLREYEISPNKPLGQHFLVDFSIFPKLANYATLQDSDVVLDVGAGFGFLSKFLSRKCKEVIAVEKDLRLASFLREETKKISNINVITGDIFKVELPDFNKVVSLPPYYLSSRLITWLLSQQIDLVVLVLQREFADRLVATIGSEDYGWLKVVVDQRAEAKLRDTIPKESFYPKPEVESSIVTIRPLDKIPFNPENPFLFQRLTKWLFTQRNKKVSNALLPFLKKELRIDKAVAAETLRKLPFQDRRVRSLSPSDFGAIADGLSKQKNIF